MNVHELLALPAEERERRIESLARHIREAEQEIQLIRTDSTDSEEGFARRFNSLGEASQRMKAEYERKLAAMESELRAMIERRSIGPKLIKDKQDEIRALQQQRAVLQNVDAVRQALTLKGKLDAASRSEDSGAGGKGLQGGVCAGSGAGDGNDANPIDHPAI